MPANDVSAQGGASVAWRRGACLICEYLADSIYCVTPLTPQPLCHVAAVSRISLVKPQKAQGITNLLIQMAQSGQIRSRINEEQLIGLLEQVERAQGSGGDGSAGKIVVSMGGVQGVQIAYGRTKHGLCGADILRMLLRARPSSTARRWLWTTTMTTLTYERMTLVLAFSQCILLASNPLCCCRGNATQSPLEA